MFNEQMSNMREVSADILQRFFISSIFFFFFNASLIEKWIEVLNFVNDISILVYNTFIKKICRTLSKIHDVYTN